jgi:hypothetical protein
MLPIERELAIAIWVLYSIDCVHWLKPGEIAFTRARRGAWKRRAYREEAFTLLGRMPVAVNPLDLRPGLIVVSATKDSFTQAGLERRARRDLKRRYSLVAVSYVAAANLLLLVPALLLNGWFEFAWKVPVTTLAATHAFILIEVFFGMGPRRRRSPGSFWPEFIALLLNPVGALRAADLFSMRLMDTGTPRS